MLPHFFHLFTILFSLNFVCNEAGTPITYERCKIVLVRGIYDFLISFVTRRGRRLLAKNVKSF